MANSCFVEMVVKGKRTDIERFVEENKIPLGVSLTTKEKPYTFWNADNAYEYDIESEDSYIKFYGNVKWSVKSSLRENNGYGEKSLEELSRNYNLTIEYYSEECGLCFQEYCLIVNGDIYVEDCVPWYQIYVDKYETYDEMARDKEMRWLFRDKELLDCVTYDNNHIELIPLRTRKNRGKLKRVLKSIYKPLFIEAKQEGESCMSIGGFDEWSFGEYQI